MSAPDVIRAGKCIFKIVGPLVGDDVVIIFVRIVIFEPENENASARKCRMKTRGPDHATVHLGDGLTTRGNVGRAPVEIERGEYGIRIRRPDQLRRLVNDVQNREGGRSASACIRGSAPSRCRQQVPPGRTQPGIEWRSVQRIDRIGLSVVDDPKIPARCATALHFCPDPDKGVRAPVDIEHIGAIGIRHSGCQDGAAQNIDKLHGGAAYRQRQGGRIIQAGRNRGWHIFICNRARYTDQWRHGDGDFIDVSSALAVGHRQLQHHVTEHIGCRKTRYIFLRIGQCHGGTNNLPPLIIHSRAVRIETPAAIEDHRSPRRHNIIFPGVGDRHLIQTDDRNDRNGNRIAGNFSRIVDHPKFEAQDFGCTQGR